MASPPSPPAYSPPDPIQRASTTVVAEKGRPKRTYKTSVPVHQLGRFAAPTDCPVCGEINMTSLKYKIGGFTHAMAFAAFGGTVIFFWVPYLMNSCKNIEQHCGNPDCDALLATWHRAPHPGCVEVHQFA